MKLKYKCLRTNIFFNNNFSLEVIQKKEIEEIRIWRNMNIDVFRQKKIKVLLRSPFGGSY